MVDHGSAAWHYKVYPMGYAIRHETLELVAPQPALSVRTGFERLTGFASHKSRGGGASRARLDVECLSGKSKGGSRIN